MRKVVYNGCYGGFSLSQEAVLLARELSGDSSWGDIKLPGEVYSDGSVCDYFYGGIYDIERHDPILVQVVEKLGSRKASGYCSRLEIEEVDGPYRIDEYDGMELVETPDSYDWVL